MEEDINDADGATDKELRKLAMKAPSRKKFEEQIRAMSQDIKEKEKLYILLQERQEESIPLDLRNLKVEKNKALERKKLNDAELRELNDNVRKKMDELGKVQSRLHYKSEDRINEAIRRLEIQLKHNNYSLREEKRIVSEIDSLSRSKKSLSQYLEQKEEVDKMRVRQKELRNDRDSVFQFITTAKRKEEEYRERIEISRNRVEDLKQEIDSLYDEKRALTADFKKIEKEFYEIKRENVQRQREDRKAQAVVKKEVEIKIIQEIEAEHRPFEDEINLCLTLIGYLKKFDSTHDKVQSPHSQPSTATTTSPVSPPPHSVPDPTTTPTTLPTTSKVQQSQHIGQGMYLLPRKSDDDEICNMRSKKHKKGKKKQQIKCLSHAPQTISQFDRLDLHPPTSATELTAVIEQLVLKKLAFEKKQQQLHSDSHSVAESCDSNMFSGVYSRSISGESTSNCDITVTDEEEVIEHDGKDNSELDLSVAGNSEDERQTTPVVGQCDNSSDTNDSRTGDLDMSNADHIDTLNRGMKNLMKSYDDMKTTNGFVKVL